MTYGWIALCFTLLAIGAGAAALHQEHQRLGVCERELQALTSQTIWGVLEGHHVP